MLKKCFIFDHFELAVVAVKCSFSTHEKLDKKKKNTRHLLRNRFEVSALNEEFGALL